MTIAAALILFSALMAVACARTRSAGPALLAGAFCVVVFATTPVGQDVFGLVAQAGARVDDAATAIGNAR